MARLRRILLPALLPLLGALLSVAAPARAAVLLGVDKTLDKVSGWSIGVNKALNGCIAAASYDDGTTVWIGFDGGRDEAFLAFTNARWRSIETDRAYRLFLLTGRGRWRGSFTGLARGDEKGLFQSGLKKSFVIDLARAGGIDVIFEGKSIARLSMSGSSDAIGAMVTCQKAVVQAKASPDTPGGDPPAREGASSGTGFFVSQAGHVLTNAHVVAGCTEIRVARVGVPAVRAQLVATDSKNDLAVLSTPIAGPIVPALSLRPRVGESVYAYGFPLPDLLAATGNFTVGNITAAAGLGDDTRMLQISTPVQPGNSGGPLLDQYGAVAGVVTSKLNAMSVAAASNDIPQNVNFAIKAMIALNFLDSNGIPPADGARSATPLDAATVAERARAFTLHVVCR